MFVGSEGEFLPRESGNEQKQGGMREMKIGEEALNSSELIRRVNIGGSGAGMGIQVGGGFKDASGGGADGDHATGSGNFFLEARADFIPFLMHGVVAEVSGFDGTEGAEADVKGDKSVMELG